MVRDYLLSAQYLNNHYCDSGAQLHNESSIEEKLDDKSQAFDVLYKLVVENFCL